MDEEKIKNGSKGIGEKKKVDVPQIVSVGAGIDKLIQEYKGAIVSARRQINYLKEMKKRYKDEVVEARKTSKRQNKVTPNGDKPVRPRSGITKEGPVSDELCELFELLGIPVGTLIARTDVTRQIIQCISEHNLQNPDKKNFVITVDCLASLLNLQAGDQIRYFDLQKPLSNHFQKSTKIKKGKSQSENSADNQDENKAVDIVPKNKE
ncbi:hypothetical protein HDU93_002408 [Gonapodya sp. JEL0774]|nr:hypothetical protein HDU93_002408 [Gonapodya sp. JEL0774]